MSAAPEGNAVDLNARLDSTVFAFRGYNVTNQGKTAELLERADYAPALEESLVEASWVVSEVTGRSVNLTRRVRQREPTSLGTFAEDIAVILAIEVAQIRILKELYGVEFSKAQMAFGYSLGEVAALICGGVLKLADALKPLVAMAHDSAELARDVTMGIVFSREAELDLPRLYKTCLEIGSEGRGMLAPSANLAPNTLLVLGERDTVDRLGARLPAAVHLRKNTERWPPLHTPLLWRCSISNRAGLMMSEMPGGLTAPRPPVFSLATGAANYNDYNSREILVRWIDHPQRLWDAVSATLSGGAEVVVHVGPEPNLIPATFRRISDNVKDQLSRRSLNSLGLRAVSTIWRPWLARWLSAKSALLRAPFLTHVTLEDWLLGRMKDEG